MTTPPEDPTLRFLHPSQLSDASLAAQLTSSYGRPTIPPCRICGASLAIAAMGGGNPTVYRCSAAKLPDGGFDWDHYGHSEHRDVSQGGDRRVLEVLARYERALQVVEDNDIRVHGLPFALYEAFEAFQAAARQGDEPSTHALARIGALVSRYGQEPLSEDALECLHALASALAEPEQEVGHVTRLVCEARTALAICARPPATV